MKKEHPERKKTSRRGVGTAFEARAAAYLEKNGCRILQRNYRCRYGEIDLIAWDEERETVVFVEVKYRRNRGSGIPEEAVTSAKQRTISRVAAWYLLNCGASGDVPCRFDVIAIEGDRIRHHRNAFEYVR